jgi:polyhydroxybutyrate depolymerase
MNGTADTINPYKGGNVSIFGFGNRGTVLSSEDTARYFVALDGISTVPIIERASEGNASSWVERATCGAPLELEVALDTVYGGGHGISRRHETSGSVSIAGDAFDGPIETWRLFAGFAR